MNRHDSFEPALSVAFAKLADGAPVAIDVMALISAVAVSAPARPADRRRLLGMRPLVLVGVAALLVIAAAITIVGAARLLERRVTVFGTFTQAAQLPLSPQGFRSIGTVTSLPDGRVWTIGWDASARRGETWSSVFDPETGTWTESDSAPAWRVGATATTLRDGRVLLSAGWSSQGDSGSPTEAVVYDPKTGRSEPTRGGQTSRRYGHTATLLNDGRVLIIGGMDSDGRGLSDGDRPEMRSAEIFDPASGAFSPVGQMSVPRAFHVAARLADGRVLIAGGTTGRGAVATETAEIFDPATGTFAPTGPMTASRSMQAAAGLLDGRVLVVGGVTSDDEPTARVTIGSAELFDPATGSFSSTASLVTERAGSAATVLPDGRVLVAGGSNDYGAPKTAELFDPSTERFDGAGASASPHPGAWSSLLPDGRVMLLDAASGASSGAPELWSAFDRPVEIPTAPATATPGFTPLRDSPTILRSGHTATRLADGRVLLTGGVDAARPGDGPSRSAEILDPSDGRSTAVGDMGSPRSGHVAVLLADGRVLVAGGEPDACLHPDTCLWQSPTAEIFDPASSGFTPLTDELGPRPYRGDGVPAGVRLADGRVFYVSTSFGSWSHRYASVVDPASGVVDPPVPIACGARVSLVRLIDDRVLVLCGGRRPYAYVFDATGTTPTEFDEPEGWDGAVGLADGRVLVVRTIGDAAIFDPASGVFSPTGSIAPQDDPDQSRTVDPFQRPLTLLSDGRVLVTGGRSIGVSFARSLASADLYDPATGTFRAIGPMNEPRLQQSATLIDDGRVLIVGGVSRSPDRTDPEPAAVEVFDPSAYRTAP